MPLRKDSTSQIFPAVASVQNDIPRVSGGEINNNSSLGYFSKIPLELRRKIYRDVLNLCNRPGEYLKGLKKKKGSKLIRTSLLTTSKAIHDEAMPVMFSANQFCLYGFRKLGPEDEAGRRTSTTSKYYMLLCLSKSEKTENYDFPAAEPRRYEWIDPGRHHERWNRSKYMNDIDHTQIPENLLRQIKYLSVIFNDGGPERLLRYMPHKKLDPFCPDFVSVIEPYKQDLPLKTASEHFLEMFSFIDRCAVLQHLHLVVEFAWQATVLPLPEPTFMLLMKLLSCIRGVRNLQLFVNYQKCDKLHLDHKSRTPICLPIGSYNPCCRPHVLSAKYYRHLVRTMRLPRGSETPGFVGDSKLREVLETDGCRSQAVLRQGDDEPLPDDGEVLHSAAFCVIWDAGSDRDGVPFYHGPSTQTLSELRENGIRPYKCLCQFPKTEKNESSGDVGDDLLHEDVQYGWWDEFGGEEERNEEELEDHDPAFAFLNEG